MIKTKKKRLKIDFRKSRWYNLKCKGNLKEVRVRHFKLYQDLSGVEYMYNAKPKEQYLSTISNENSRKAAKRIFNASEVLEHELGKDLSDFSDTELLYFLETETGTRDHNSSLSLIRTYNDWCITAGNAIGTINAANKITSSDIDKRNMYHEKYLMNSEEFENMVSVVFADGVDYNETTDKAKELIVRLCYLGMENEEITQLKKEMVDYEEHLICSPLYPDFFYVASERILQLCKYCSEQTVAIYNSKNGIERTESLCNNDYVIRQRIGTLKGNDENRSINSVKVVREVQEFSKRYSEVSGNQKRITADKLRESGLFHGLYQAENKDEYVNSGIKTDILLRKPEVTERQLYERLRQIKKSYSMWEAAFEYQGTKFKFNYNRNGKKNEPEDIFAQIMKAHSIERNKKEYTIQENERNRKLVQDMKKVYGCRCQLCKEDNFLDIVMENGSYYVEVHHIVPNAEGIDEEGTLDRPNNMIVVCPNHHRYLHYNRGGGYRLTEIDNKLYLANSTDRIEIQRDLHLRKYSNM